MQPVQPTLFPTYHVEDYARPLDLSAYIASAGDMREDRERAAERDAAFERQAREIAAGMVRMVEDIRAGGILEDNLAAVRRYVTEESLSQAASVQHFNHEVARFHLQRGELHEYRRTPEGKKLIRDIGHYIEDTERTRDIVAIASDAYSQALEALKGITPKRLSAADYAALALIDHRLAELRSLQDVVKQHTGIQKQSADDEPGVNRAYALLGALVAGMAALYTLGPLASLLASAIGAYVAPRFLRDRKRLAF